METISPLNSPFLSLTQIQSLQTYEITTFIELIHTPKEVVCSSLGITETEYLRVRFSALEYIQKQPTSLRQTVTAKSVTPRSTGISFFDKLLGGGLYPGDIIELYGKTGSGKTLLSLYLTARICHFSDDAPCVLYFDMKNDFNALRLFRFCEKSDESLNRVSVFKEANLDALFSQLKDIKNCFVGGIDNVYCNSKLLVIDSVPMALYPAVPQESYSWRHHQEMLIEMLRWLANHLDLTVILVNHAVTTRPNVRSNGCESSSASSQPVVKPALGKYWRHKINIRVCLSKINGSSNCFEGRLDKSYRSSEGQRFKFCIDKENLVELKT